MAKKQNRKLFSFALTDSEKKTIDLKAAQIGLTRAAYIRSRIFQADSNALESTRDPLTNNAIPEVNVKTYRTLKEIASRLDRLSEMANSPNPITFNRIEVERALLEETLSQLEIIGAQLAIQTANLNRL
ncbi:MAG: hypothetical protein QNJ54_28455 [Prochloraceae cyanobacterium]|nr:hypothetical protein [Prochloraceae cyanobacterium]